MILRRFISFFGFSSEVVTAISWRRSHRDLLKIELAQNLADRLGADHRRERVLAVLLLSAKVLVLGQELTFLEGRQARLDDDVGLEIKDALQLLERHVEQKTDPARQRLQEPDVRDGSREFDVPHAVAPHARERHLDAALLADDALVLHALVLAAQALVVLDGPKDARAEQAVALGLEGAVVDGLRLLDLAVGPGQNLLRARDRDLDLIEALRLRGLIKEIHDLLVHRCLLIPAPVMTGSGPVISGCEGASGAKFFPEPSSFCLRVTRAQGARHSAASEGGTSCSFAACLVLVSSTLRPSERISLTSTLKLSGMPDSKVSSPRTIAS